MNDLFPSLISYNFFELYFRCRVPQLMSVLLIEFLSAFDIFSVFIKIDFVHVD